MQQESIGRARFFDLAKKSLLRFPLSLIFAAVLSISCIQFIIFDQVFLNTELLHSIIKVSYLGMLLSISASLYIESRGLAVKLKLAVYGLVLALCLFYFLFLLTTVTDAEWIRFLVLASALHLFVSFAGFKNRQSARSLWEFNKHIFLRIFLSFLYSGVLFLGLSLALIGIDALLKVDISNKTYSCLWIVIAAFFNTWFFLAGIPSLSKLAETSSAVAFPRGLKVFTAYVLLPLVGLYLIILYLYLFRLLRAGDWTGAWSSVLILAMAIFGILSFLLLHPLLKDPSHTWVKKMSQVFYLLTLPLALIMIMAASKNIAGYGFTEYRYLRLVLGLWLIFISISSIKWSERKLKRIPFSLFLVSIFSCFGPWSMGSISLRSQHMQLEAAFSRNHMLVNGKISSTHKFAPLSDQEKYQINTALNYLISNGGIESVQDLFEDDVSRLTKGNTNKHARENELEKYLLSLQITSNTDPPSIESTPATEAIETRSFHLNSNVFIPTQGYDYQIDFSLNDASEAWKELILNDTIVSLRYIKERQEFELKYGLQPLLILKAEETFKNLFPLHSRQNNIQHMSIAAENSVMSARIIFISVQLNKIVDVSAEHIKGKLQIKLK